MKVLLAGCGNIGKWHLESLIKSNKIKSINIVDSNIEKIDISFSDITANISLENDYKKTYDIGIVATCANDRYNVIKQIKNKCKYLILEKFLFNDPEEYINLNNAYVHCPRRAMPCYGEFEGIKKNIYYWGFEGLLSNVIHFADLFAFVTGNNDLSFEFYIGRKEKTKRKGYYDSSGNVIIRGGNNYCFIETEGKEYFLIGNISINEYKKIYGDPPKKFDFKLPSEFTTTIVEDLYEHGTCKLTSYNISKEWHLKILEALREKGWKKAIT